MKTNILSVNYDTPDLIYAMVKSFRQFYDNDILIIDGSDKKEYEEAKVLLSEFDDIEIHHFGFNLHHGNSLNYAIPIMDCDKILVIDSDVVILKGGILELLENKLKPESYGVGDIQRVDDFGYNIGPRKGAVGLRESDQFELGYAYLHPAFMLINREIALQWPMPIKHGAPMIETMKAISKAGKEDLLIHCDQVHEGFRSDKAEYLIHPWQGTVNRFGYNL